MQIECTEGEVVVIPMGLAESCKTLKDMLDDFDVNNVPFVSSSSSSEASYVYPVPMVRANVLEKICQWYGGACEDVSGTDDLFFTNFEMREKLDLLNACDFLALKPLLTSCIKSIAHDIAGNSIEDMCNTFNLTTPEHTPDISFFSSRS